VRVTLNREGKHEEESLDSSKGNLLTYLLTTNMTALFTSDIIIASGFGFITTQ